MVKGQDGEEKIIWGSLGILALILVYSKTLYYNQAHDTDIYFYSSLGHEFLKGRSLYSDLWDARPPAMIWTCALAETLCGYGRPSIFFLNVFLNLVALFGAFACGSRLTGKPITGLLAAAFWVFISGDIWLQANQPFSELFINAFLLWAFAILVGLDPRKACWNECLAIGALWALCTLYKQTPIWTALFCVVAHYLTAEKFRKTLAAQQILVMGSVGAVTWMLVFFYFALTHRLGLFLASAFGFSMRHSAFGVDLWSGLTTANLWPNFMFFLLPMLILAVAGYLWDSGKIKRHWYYLLAFALAVPIEVSIRGTFYRHYYQLWFPVLCVGAAWAIESFWKRWGGKKAVLLAAVALLPLVVRQVSNWRLPSYQSMIIGGGVGFAPLVGEEIDEELLPGEGYYEWTYNLYFSMEAKKDLVVGVPFGMFLYMQPMEDELTSRVLEQLEKKKPELLVFDTQFHMQDESGKPFEENPVYRYLTHHYKPYSSMGANNRFLFCYLKGGALEKRVLARNVPKKVRS